MDPSKAFDLGLQLLGAVGLWYGLRMLAKKNRVGAWLCLVAEVLWIVWGLRHGGWFLVAMSVALSADNILILRTWGAEAKTVRREGLGSWKDG